MCEAPTRLSIPPSTPVYLPLSICLSSFHPSINPICVSVHVPVTPNSYRKCVSTRWRRFRCQSILPFEGEVHPWARGGFKLHKSPAPHTAPTSRNVLWSHSPLKEGAEPCPIAGFDPRMWPLNISLPSGFPAFVPRYFNNCDAAFHSSRYTFTNTMSRKDSPRSSWIYFLNLQLLCSKTTNAASFSPNSCWKRA